MLVCPYVNIASELVLTSYFTVQHILLVVVGWFVRWEISGRKPAILLGAVLRILSKHHQKCHSKVMHRKEVTHSNGSYERKWRGRKLADEMGRAKKNSRGTLIDWCTGREWPVNCMTVISAWWRSNMRFQRSSWRLSGRELLYNPVKTEVKLVPVRVGDGVGRDVVSKATSGRRGLGAPDELQLEIGRSYRRDVVRKATPRPKVLGALMNWGPEKLLIRCSRSPSRVVLWDSDWASGERERHNVDCHKSGGQNVAVMFGLQLHLTRKPWLTFSNPCNKVRGTYIYKEVFLRLFIYCVVMML